MHILISMKKGFLIIILLVATVFNLSFGQQFLLPEKIIKTDSTDNSFKDLGPLKELWEDKRIILLGEQSHGEGTVFKEKIRLIKFLHQEMGFEILAFESGLYDNFYVYQQVKSGEALTETSLQESILPIWSDCQELLPLYAYVHEQAGAGRELQVSGFDTFTSDLKDEFWKDLQSKVQLDSLSWGRLEEVFFGNADVLMHSPEDELLFFKVTERLLEDLDKKANKSNYLLILEQTFKTWVREIKYQVADLKGEKIYVQNPRDAWMADNLIFLSELYPDKKIIAWGASYHFANKISEYENTDLTKEFIDKMEDDNHKTGTFNLDSALHGAVTMGELLKKQFDEQLYSMAFSSYEGQFGLVFDDHLTEVPRPPSESIEDLLVKSDIDQAIVDYKHLSDRNFYSSALGNLPIRAPWGKAFDGLYFIKKISPPQLVSYKSQQEELSRLGSNNIEDNIFGQVIDAKTNAPIPYVNIMLEGTSKGTASNGKGDFMFNFLDNGSLIFSCIGYESDTISIQSVSGKSKIKIWLQPKSYLLSEVLVTSDPLSAKEIIKRARKNIDENYFQKSLNQEVYYQVQHATNDSTTFNEEGSIMLYSEKGYTPKTKLYGNILQYRKKPSLKRESKWSGLGSIWLMTGHDVILDKDNVVFRTGAYDLSIAGILEYAGRKVYDIYFQCKRPGAFTTGFGYPAPQAATGHVYITTDDYAVVKFDLCVVRQPHVYKKHEHLSNDPWHHHLSQTYKRHYNKYFLNTSFVQHRNRTVNDQTKQADIFEELRYLTTTEIIKDKVIPIEKPLIKIKQGKVKQEDGFWQNHNYVLNPGKSHVFYCDQPDSFFE